MLSSPLVFRQFFYLIILGLLLFLWNPSCVETYDADGVNYNLDHIKLDDGESIWAWEVPLKTICDDRLFADILNRNPRLSYVKLTDDELDKLLYSVLLSLNYHYRYVRYAWDDLSLKNFPEVLKLHFKTPSHIPPYTQLLDGLNLYIGSCRDQAALKAPMKGTWIISKKKVNFPSYSQMKPATTYKPTTKSFFTTLPRLTSSTMRTIKSTTKITQKTTHKTTPKIITSAPVKQKDCSYDLILSKDITWTTSNLNRNDWVTLVNKYRTDREFCLAKSPTKSMHCLCSVNENLKSTLPVVRLENAV